MTFNSSTREGALSNKYLYNQGTGKKTFKTERQFELGWDMTKFRMYDYALGRFTGVDPLADVNPQESWTPYQYGYNNPIRYNDPYGDCPDCWQYLYKALDFSSGFANAVASNNVLGAGRQSGGSSSFQSGQTAGDVVSVIQGVVETLAGGVVAGTGGTVTVVSVGTASPVSVPATVAGVAIAGHGLTVTGTALKNLNAEGESNSSQSNQSTNKDVSTKKDRQKSETQLERSQNQLEGIEKAQQSSKKQVKGDKQNKIQSTEKSEQRLNNELKNIKSLDDLE